MPALDLALSPEMIESVTEIIFALLFEPLGEVAGDLRRTIVADELGFVVDLGLPAAGCIRPQSQCLGNIFRPRVMHVFQAMMEWEFSSKNRR